MVFDFQNILATNVLETTRVTPAKKGKYDFAVAYPDPVSLPHVEILECLREALAESGSELAVYPHPQGNTPLRQYVAEKIEDNSKCQITKTEYSFLTQQCVMANNRQARR